MQYRFKGFCLGMLTRESVRQALKSGITAEQIINFLTINAHPTLTQQPRVPSTIMDQIRLWEIERDRFIYRDGVLYSQFLSQSDFELLRNYSRVSFYSAAHLLAAHDCLIMLAQDAGYLIWDFPAKRVMVVSSAGHEDVRSFWKRHKKGHKDSKK